MIIACKKTKCRAIGFGSTATVIVTDTLEMWKAPSSSQLPGEFGLLRLDLKLTGVLESTGY
jgi:hypothetical protein